MKSFVWLAMLVAAAPCAAETAAARVSGLAAGSQIEGRVVLQDSRKGVTVTVRVHGLAPGPHGLHIHEFGDCGDAGRAAGSHYNPYHALHGDAVKSGIKKAHAGDLGNLVADARGDASVELTLRGLSVSGGRRALAGRAVVIDEKADDFSQPAGNAGGRIACGVIALEPEDAAHQ